MVLKVKNFRPIRSGPGVVPALVVDLEDADGRRLTGRGEMGAAAGLPVEADDLDDADLAVGRGRRCHRAAADQAMLGLGLAHRDVGEADGDVLADQIVDRSFERAQAVVVGAGHVEIHARRAVLGHLHSRYQGAVEALEDQRVQDVRVGVELAHLAPEGRIDCRLDAARDVALGVEQVPKLAGGIVKAGDLGLAALPAQDAAVGELAATARIERRARQHDPAGPQTRLPRSAGSRLRAAHDIKDACRLVDRTAWRVLAKIARVHRARDGAAARAKASTNGRAGQ